MLVLYRDIVNGANLFIKDKVTSFDMNLLASGCFFAILSFATGTSYSVSDILNSFLGPQN